MLSLKKNEITFKEKLISFLKKVIAAIPTALLLVGLASLLSYEMRAPFSFTASFLTPPNPMILILPISTI